MREVKLYIFVTLLLSCSSKKKKTKKHLAFQTPVSLLFAHTKILWLGLVSGEGKKITFYTANLGLNWVMMLLQR